MTASRDRTNEYPICVVQLMRGRLGNGGRIGRSGVGVRNKHSRKLKARCTSAASSTQLARRRWRRDLKSTCAKVEKLALLAKRQQSNAARREQFSATSSTVDLLASLRAVAQDDELHRTSSDVAIDMSGAEANWRRQLLDQNEETTSTVERTQCATLNSDNGR
uniref:Uncharacterized protein n=1 Tax=Macrostomum lignano TaxID=282301 RepID=A0A1I8FM56_9PLAT